MHHKNLMRRGDFQAIGKLISREINMLVEDRADLIGQVQFWWARVDKEEASTLPNFIELNSARTELRAINSRLKRLRTQQRAFINSMKAISE